MKICFLFNHFQHQDGIARAAIGIANILSESGNFDVTLLPIYIYKTKDRDLLYPNVRVKRFLGFYFKGLSSIVHKISPRLLYKLCVREEYDIEIAFMEGIATMIVAHSIRPQKVRIAWIHNLEAAMKQRELYPFFAKVICVSKYNANKLKGEMPNLNVDFCYNPIDDKEVTRLGNEVADITKNNCITFVSVGRISPEKGFERLLDCVAILKGKGFRFELWLVGDGPQLNALKTKACELGIDDIVTFIGKKKNPHKYTSKADVFICSSYTEGYSTACTEAVILGVPVISTLVPGAEEIISASGCGILAGKDDTSLQEAMEKVLCQPTIIDEWKKTLNITKKRFSMENRKMKLFVLLNNEL